MTSSVFEVKIKELVYHQPQGQALLARLYLPKSPEVLPSQRFPALVSVHGGRWSSESRLTNEVIDSYLARAGIVVMAIDFRMPPVVKFPLPVADINLAIRWLKAHAHEYQTDPRNVGGLGTSSGGHQLLLNALTPMDSRFTTESLQASNGQEASLSYVVLGWPVSDPLARYHYAVENKMQRHLDAHDAYWANELEMKNGSPQNILDSGLATHMPPILIVQGGSDTTLSPGMSEKFARSYDRLGGQIQLCLFGTQEHTFITKKPQDPDSLAALSAIAKFVLNQAVR
jgi:acetyl esterase/lipase